MIAALGAIATQKYTPTQNTMKNGYHLLDYTVTQPDAIINYHASDMVLAVHRDESYLSESKARRRVDGHLPLSNNSIDPPNNEAVLTVAQIIKTIMSSAVEV